MKRWMFTLLVIGVLSACDQQPPEEPIGPSPISSFDKTRLWILVKAARIGDGLRCRDYYLAPDDPRYINRAKECEAWTLDFTDYLRLNGLSTLDPEHVRDPVYWQWYKETKQSINDCRGKYLATVRDKGEQRAAKSKAKHACDPYDDARKNKKQTPKDLGIVFTGKASPTPKGSE